MANEPRNLETRAAAGPWRSRHSARIMERAATEDAIAAMQSACDVCTDDDICCECTREALEAAQAPLNDERRPSHRVVVRALLRGAAHECPPVMPHDSHRPMSREFWETELEHQMAHARDIVGALPSLALCVEDAAHGNGEIAETADSGGAAAATALEELCGALHTLVDMVPRFARMAAEDARAIRLTARHAQ
jgi:hypothetical protein